MQDVPFKCPIPDWTQVCVRVGVYVYAPHCHPHHAIVIAMSPPPPLQDKKHDCEAVCS